MRIEKNAPGQLLVNDDPRKIFNGDGSFDLLKKALVKTSVETEIEERLVRQAHEKRRGRRNLYPNKSAFAQAPQSYARTPRGRQDASSRELSVSDPGRFPGVHEKILSMYARGMSAREIQSHLFELYGIDFSQDTIAMAMGAVPGMIAEWQARPLEAAYPLVFFDSLRVKIREEGFVRSKVVCIALGIQTDGAKDILGLWIENAEDAGFWPRAMNELRSRGVRDVLIAVVDGLKGIPEAINALFPRTVVQAGIVHLIRHSLDFPNWAERKILAGALQTIYEARDAGAAEAALDAFAAGPWGEKYPAIAQNWRRNWAQVVPFFALPEAVRRIIYARKTIEALNEKLRRAARARSHFSSDEAALFLVLRSAAGESKMPPREWSEARIQLAVLFDERFVPA